MATNSVILIRGVPGSGKSTLARIYAAHGYEHLEADMFFISPITGNYVFDPRKIQYAHRWCQAQFKAAMVLNRDIVVSNTFIKLWELEYYLALAPHARIIRCTGNYESVHGVPKEKIEQMKNSYESHPQEEIRI